MDELEITSVTERYELSEADLNQQVSDIHIEEIPDFLCEKWRSLPPYLEMEAMVAKDINRDHSGCDEREKRSSFFNKWKEMKGQEATYKKLIHALIKRNDIQSAESVCKLIARSRLAGPQHSDTLANPAPKASNALSELSMRYLFLINEVLK